MTVPKTPGRHSSSLAINLMQAPEGVEDPVNSFRPSMKRAPSPYVFLASLNVLVHYLYASEELTSSPVFPASAAYAGAVKRDRDMVAATATVVMRFMEFTLWWVGYLIKKNTCL